MLYGFPLNDWALFFFTQAMRQFLYFIIEHGLIDLPLEGGISLGQTLVRLFQDRGWIDFS